jgi:hypothetical protein
MLKCNGCGWWTDDYFEEGTLQLCEGCWDAEVSVEAAFERKRELERLRDELEGDGLDEDAAALLRILARKLRELRGNHGAQ